MPIPDVDKFSPSQPDAQVCPYCGELIFQIPRTGYDRWINSLTLGLKRRSRFKCTGCHKEFIINKGKSANN